MLYPVTPMLSVLAVHVRVICDDDGVADRFVGVEGGVVSVDACV